MTVLLNVIAPIFGVAALGFLAARLRLLSAAGVQGLVLFVFDFAIPVLLFRTLATIALPAHIEWSFLVAFYTGSAATYALGMATGRFVFRRPPDQAAIYGMSAGFCNTVLIGIPVILTAFGPEATLPLFLIISFHAATLMPLTVGLIQGHRGLGVPAGEQARTVAKSILGNPIVIGLALGLAANVSGLTMPGPIDRATSLLGDAAVPCSLFAMGASLSEFRFAGEARPALALAALKLVAHPLIVWTVGALLLGVTGLWLAVAVTMAAMPSGVNVYLFGARYDAAPGVAAATVLITSVLSAATLSVLLLVLHG